MNQALLQALAVPDVPKEVSQQPIPKKENAVISQAYASLATPTWSQLRTHAGDVEGELRMLCLSRNAGVDNAVAHNVFFRKTVQNDWTEVCTRLIGENTLVSHRMLAALFASPWTSMSMYDIVDTVLTAPRRNDLFKLIVEGQPGRLRPELITGEAKRSGDPELAQFGRNLLATRAQDEAAFKKITENRKRLIHEQMEVIAAPYRAARVAERNARREENDTFRIEANVIFAERCRRCGLDPAQPHEALKAAMWDARFNQSLDVYCLRDGISALVWREGMQAGKIFELADTKTAMEQRAQPTAEHFRENVINLLYKLDSELIGAKPWEKATLKMNLHTSIARLYHEGTSDFLPLAKARLRDQGLNQLCSRIHDRGVKNWLNDFAKSQDLGRLKISEAPDSCDWGSFYLSTFNKEQIGQADYSHGTTSAILPGLLSMGALLSSDELNRLELTKVAGEDERSQTGQDPDLVSFWDHGQGGNMQACFGEISGLDFPIALTVAKKAMAGYIVQQGVLPTEVTVPNRLLLEDIEYLLVPPFAQQYVKELLELHGYGCVKVEPLTV